MAKKSNCMREQIESDRDLTGADADGGLPGNLRLSLKWVATMLKRKKKNANGAIASYYVPPLSKL